MTLHDLEIEQGRHIGYTPNTKLPVFALDTKTPRNEQETVYSTVLASGVCLVSRVAPETLVASENEEARR